MVDLSQMLVPGKAGSSEGRSRRDVKKQQQQGMCAGFPSAW